MIRKASLILTFQRRVWLLPALALLGLLCGATAPAMAGTPPTLNITQGTPAASPDDVTTNQSTTLKYVIQIQNGTAGEAGSTNGEISSQSYEVMASLDDDGTIKSVSTSDPTEYTVGPIKWSTTDNCWVCTITAGAYSDPTVVVTVVASAPTTGNKSVAIIGQVVEKSGSKVGPVGVGVATIYQVQQTAVSITGDPYIIVANGSDGVSDANFSYSKYTASINGALATPYQFSWYDADQPIAFTYVTPNAGQQHAGSGGASTDTVECQGAKPISPTNYMGCSAFDTNGTMYNGTYEPTVQNEYVVLNQGITAHPNGTPQLVGSIFIVDPPNGSMTLSKGDSFSVSVTEGVSISASAELTDFVKASVGAQLSSTQQWTWTQSISYTQNLLPGSYQWQLTPVMEEKTGTAQLWKPSGADDNVSWTDEQPDTAIVHCVTVNPK